MNRIETLVKDDIPNLSRDEVAKEFREKART